MNHQLVRNAGVILMFSFLAACTGTDTKTGEETNTDTVTAAPKPKPFDVLGMVHRAASAPGAGPVLPMTVQYGIKQGAAAQCNAGAGICNVTGTGSGSTICDTLQIVGGSLVITTDKALLDTGAGVPVYDSFKRYGMNGVVSYGAGFNFGRPLSRKLGAADTISIKQGMPMVFASNESEPGKVKIITYGAIRGNSACVSFNNCAGNASSFSLSLAAADADCLGQAYTGFYDAGDGSGTGTLVVYMRTDSMPGLGDCMPHPDPGSLATTWLNFQLASDVEINPNTTSIPAGSVISAAQNNAQQLAIYPTGWCMLTLNVTLPGGDKATTKK
ncbi:hypothetical protein [Polluticoccus soli]|uniref:hypothetical protein n=1 Tax=Polluticoccus soli TaxID=3034150 RepID=UPI0023E32AA4|nr:hypothetical protein [Flavipsychrobacter sp. JY13-12]